MSCCVWEEFLLDVWTWTIKPRVQLCPHEQLMKQQVRVCLLA